MPSSQPSYLIATIEAQSCTKLSAGIMQYNPAHAAHDLRATNLVIQCIAR